MMHTLTIELSEETFVVIQDQAKEKGVEPAQVATEWLSDAARRAEGMTDVGNHMPVLKYDPLDDFIGSMQSGVTDFAERHHDYLGETIWKEMQSDADPSSIR